MTEEELKQKQKKLDEAFFRYMQAEKEAREAKELYEKRIVNTEWKHALAYIALGYVIGELLFNLARLLS